MFGRPLHFVLALAILAAGCSAQTSSSTPGGFIAAQTHAVTVGGVDRYSTSCNPAKENCVYFKPRVVSAPGLGNSFNTTLYTSPTTDTDTPVLKQRSGTCYGYHWQYTNYVNPGYVVGSSGNSLLWAVTITEKQTGKGATGPTAGSTCVMAFGNSAGRGNLTINVPSGGG